jgi:ribose 5-phosphate isomerase A
MSQNDLKRQAAQAAWEYLEGKLSSRSILGVGTGSTVNHFIDVLSQHRDKFFGAVASSETTAKKLHACGIALVDANEVSGLLFYVDGADEVDPQLRMIKGGGGALTREKIVAALSEFFVCLADESKYVPQLGRFPLPIEVIPMAREYVVRQLRLLGGQAVLRPHCLTDNGHCILDVTGLNLACPEQLEATLNNISGVVANGLFAQAGADVLFLAEGSGVRQLRATDAIVL